MIELRFLAKPGTSTEAPKLQYRTFDRVDGWTHYEWSAWKDVPTAVVGFNKPTATESPGPVPMESGGSVTLPVGLPGFNTWVEP